MAPWPAYRFLLVIAYLLPLVHVASAQDKDHGSRRAAALHWVRLPGAEDCSGGDALSRAVETKLRREVFPAPRNASVLIEGHIERVPSGYHAQLQMRATDGTLLGSRELSSEAADCAELSETIAVVLAVMIDPEAATQGAEFEAPAEPAEPVPAADTTQAAKWDDRYAQRLLGFARAGYQILPVRDNWTGGLGLAYELALGRWGGLRVEGVGFFTQEEVIAYPPGVMLFRLAYAGLAYCPLWFSMGRLRSAACAGGELGWITTEGAGFTRDLQRYPLWASGSLSARFALRLIERLELHLGAGALFPIARPSYDTLPASGAALETHAIAASIDLGLGVRF